MPLQCLPTASWIGIRDLHSCILRSCVWLLSVVPAGGRWSQTDSNTAAVATNFRNTIAATHSHLHRTVVHPYLLQTVCQSVIQVFENY